MMSNQTVPVIALFLPDLEMGGGERMFVTLARQFIQQGYRVRFILAVKTGPLLEEIEPAVVVVDLGVGGHWGPSWLFVLRTLLKLRSHLAKAPPVSLLSTLTGANLVAIAARALSRREFRLVIRGAVTLQNVQGKARLLAMRWFYRLADEIIALTLPMKVELV